MWRPRHTERELSPKTESFRTMPHYFLITSYGRTATMWLSKLISEKPDTSVSHGPFPVPCETSADNLPPPAERHRYIQTIGSQSLRQFFAIKEKNHPGMAIYGNVHGFTAREAHHRLREPNCPVSSFCNLTRHPIARINSLTNRWTKELSWSPSFHLDQNEQLARTPAVHPLLREVLRSTKEDRHLVLTFFRSVYTTLSADMHELAMPGIVNFRMEDFTTKPSHLAELLDKTLPNGDQRLPLPPEEAIAMQKINALQPDNQTPEPT